MILDSEWTLNPTTSVLVRERRGRFETEIEKKEMCRQRRRLALCYHKPRTVWSHWKLEETRKCAPWAPLEGAWPALYSSDFWIPKP